MHAGHQEKGIAPEVESAWLHHRFSQIHPFQDGNGRVSRLLASLVLLRAGLFPMVVPREEKDIYIETLEYADGGDLQPLVYLIARRQQVVFEKATWSISKLAPDSE
jgi:Fic family protein